MGGVLAAVDDLFFGAKIVETARQLNVPLALVGPTEDLIAKARAVRPGLLILDLNAESSQPLERIRRVRAEPELGDIVLLGFFSHVQHEIKTAALEAGCHRVMARSVFTTQLPEFLRPYATG